MIEIRRSAFFVRACVPVLLVVAGFLLLYLYTYDPLKFRCPTDQELREIFQARRSLFLCLKDMAIQDMGSIAYLDRNVLQYRSLSESRRNAYKETITAIRKDLIIRIDQSVVSFSYYSGGFSLSIARSWLKGIAFLPDGAAKVGTVVESLDRLPSQDGVFLVPISDGWYIIYSQS